MGNHTSRMAFRSPGANQGCNGPFRPRPMRNVTTGCNGFSSRRARDATLHIVMPAE